MNNDDNTPSAHYAEESSESKYLKKMRMGESNQSSHYESLNEDDSSHTAGSNDMS
jgi:hypothetical protein